MGIFLTEIVDICFDYAIMDVVWNILHLHPSTS